MSMEYDASVHIQAAWNEDLVRLIIKRFQNEEARFYTTRDKNSDWSIRSLSIDEMAQYMVDGHLGLHDEGGCVTFQLHNMAALLCISPASYDAKNSSTVLIGSGDKSVWRCYFVDMPFPDGTRMLRLLLRVCKDFTVEKAEITYE